MNLLITGANGFIGKNLKAYLGSHSICEFNKGDDLSKVAMHNFDFVIHLAAVHRSNNPDDFTKYNINFTYDLINACSLFNVPIIYTSSIQSSLNTPYGISKLTCQKMMQDYFKENKYCKIFNLTNTFGEFSNPNYLSVVATFCYNISHGRDVTISDPNLVYSFTYVKDVVRQISDSISYSYRPGLIEIEPKYKLSLQELYDVIINIHNGNIENSDLYVKMKNTYDYFKELA